MALSKALDSSSGRRIDLVQTLPFILVHVVALVGPFLVGFSWKLAALAVLLYYVRMAGTTIAYHRYFSHRAFKTSRWFQALMAFWAQTSVQKGALWWAAHHRDHHRFSDLEGDVHSPKDGFWESHMLWILRDGNAGTKDIKDFAKFPELRFLNTFHVLPPVALAVALFLVGSWPALIWGFFVSTVLLWHGTFFVNSLNHVWGSRRYQTTDTSRNNGFLALITMGEGWHNNHHHYMSSARQGFMWWEIDPSYYLIRGFAALGLVWDVREVPEKWLKATAPVAEQAEPVMLHAAVIPD